MLTTILRRSAQSIGICICLAQPAAAYEEIVKREVFTLNSYTTVGGETIKDVKVGWEAYGTLNADKSNAILVTHFFSGTKHAAGKYHPDDKAPGYWDSIIGPGKPLDTDKFYVISSDTLVNLNVNDPNVVTTGPASVNPDTGKPYGMDFPVVTFGDFVEVQKALIDSLGIEKLHAVIGASMGGLQGYEWAERYPNMVERLVAVIAASDADPYLIGWLDLWAAPIRVDANWKGGAYYGGEPPAAGLAEALKMVTLHAQHWQWADTTFERAPAEEGKDPAAEMNHAFKIEATLDAAGAARAKVSDANHFLYLVKANQLADVQEAAIKAPTLIIYSPTDLIFPAAKVEATAEAIRAGGAKVETATLEGPNGHLNGVLGIAQAGDKIAEFLAR